MTRNQIERFLNVSIGNRDDYACPLWEIAYQLAVMNERNDGLVTAEAGKRDAGGQRGDRGIRNRPWEELFFAANAVLVHRREEDYTRLRLAVKALTESVPPLAPEPAKSDSLVTTEPGERAAVSEGREIPDYELKRDRDAARDSLRIAVQLKLKAQGELDAANQHVKILQASIEQLVTAGGQGDEYSPAAFIEYAKQYFPSSYKNTITPMLFEFREWCKSKSVPPLPPETAGQDSSPINTEKELADNAMNQIIARDLVRKTDREQVLVIL